MTNSIKIKWCSCNKKIWHKDVIENIMKAWQQYSAEENENASDIAGN